MTDPDKPLTPDEILEWAATVVQAMTAQERRIVAQALTSFDMEEPHGMD